MVLKELERAETRGCYLPAEKKKESVCMVVGASDYEKGKPIREGAWCGVRKTDQHNAGNCKAKTPVASTYPTPTSSNKWKACYNCGDEGHFSREFPHRKRSPRRTFTSAENWKVCYNCDSPDHVPRQCPLPRRENKEGKGK